MPPLGVAFGYIDCTAWYPEWELEQESSAKPSEFPASMVRSCDGARPTAALLVTTTLPLTSSILVARSVVELRASVAALRATGREIAFVPTMGALHAGHLSLIATAAASGSAVVLSIFVNPTQFGPTEDLAAYPRSEERDLDLAAEAGAELAFCPDAPTMYPAGATSAVRVTGPSDGFEGLIRPHHFGGVATVVCALLNMVRPDRLILGQKDAQQVAVVRRMIRDLAFDDVELVVAPTVREPDGLAMSSRNSYLDIDERRAALALSRALAAGCALVSRGERDARVIEAAAWSEMNAQPGCEPDYAALVDPDGFTSRERLDAPSTLCVAARIGSTRLIDNAVLIPTQTAS